MADYLRLTCEDGSPAEIARALGAIARARGMTEIAAKVWHYATGALQGAERRGKSENSQPSPKWPKPSASALRSNPWQRRAMAPRREGAEWTVNGESYPHYEDRSDLRRFAGTTVSLPANLSASGRGGQARLDHLLRAETLFGPSVEQGRTAILFRDGLHLGNHRGQQPA